MVDSFGRALGLHAGDCGSSPGFDRPNSFNQIVNDKGPRVTVVFCYCSMECIKFN